MGFLFFCLAVSSFAMNADSQTFNPNLANDDLIYFGDNRPYNGQANRQTHASDIYSQAQFIRPDDSQIQFTRPINSQTQFTRPVDSQTQFNRPVDSQTQFKRPVNSQSQFNRPVEAQQPINGQNFGPYEVNDASQRRPIKNQNVQRKPENNLNNVQTPVIDPNVDNRQSDENDNSIQVVREKNKVHFDYTAAALTNFSLNVMKTAINHKKGNTVLSPYSIAALLSLLQQGATDQALSQISETLQMDKQATAAAYRAQSQDIQSRSSRNILRTANNVFLADAFNLNPAFRAVAQRDFSSDVTPTVFQRSYQAAQLINSWVASKTENKIKDLINPESLSSNTQMVLVNAVYFKGFWEIPFRTEATKPDTFQYSDGTKKDLPFMAIKRRFKGGHDKYLDCQLAVLPFEREEYSLMILLPSNQSNPDELIRSLTVAQLENYMNLRRLDIALRLPKFTIKADTDLSPVLKEMGVSKIFEQNSGLSDVGTFRDFIPQVSSAVHSAILSIDEEGGSAAAASAFAVVALSNDTPYMFMKVDRPFVVILWDGKTKLPLFIAKIEDPRL